MKAVRHFALMLAILWPMLAPAMACALPNAHLSPAERACCTQMKDQCGSMAMPASHGCCHKEAPTAGQWNATVQVNHADIQINLSANAELHPVNLLPIPVAISGAQYLGSTLPQSPPSSISVLRI
jgi:hypothetical protein